MEDRVLEVGLGERGVHLVDLTDLDVLRNDAVPGEERLSFLSGLVASVGRHLASSLEVVESICLWRLHVRIVVTLCLLVYQ